MAKKFKEAALRKNRVEKSKTSAPALYGITVYNSLGRGSLGNLFLKQHRHFLLH
jgi:hypothetical protein